MPVEVLDLALKEWAAVCDLLVDGRCAFVLRKGGVHEDGGPGRFKLAHDRFALFPAWEHQRLDWIKPGWARGAVEYDREPQTLDLRGWAEVARIWAVPSREAFDRLDDLHPWLPPQIDMRFNYKPDRPLYVLLLRAYQLETPKTVAMNKDYWGCKSWVPLVEGDCVEAVGRPAMDDAAFAAVGDRVAGALST